MFVKTDAGKDPAKEDQAHSQLITEAEMRITAGHVITLYDSGVLKDRIAEMLNISRNDIDDILCHRSMKHLDKPDPEKPAFQIFPKALEYIQHGRCPCCKKIVNTGQAFDKTFDPDSISSPFRDDLSRKEYAISRLCQDCQDKVFGVD